MEKRGGEVKGWKGRRGKVREGKGKGKGKQGKFSLVYFDIYNTPAYLITQGPAVTSLGSRLPHDCS